MKSLFISILVVGLTYAPDATSQGIGDATPGGVQSPNGLEGRAKELLGPHTFNGPGFQPPLQNSDPLIIIQTPLGGVFDENLDALDILRNYKKYKQKKKNDFTIYTEQYTKEIYNFDYSKIIKNIDIEANFQTFDAIIEARKKMTQDKNWEGSVLQRRFGLSMDKLPVIDYEKYQKPKEFEEFLEKQNLIESWIQRKLGPSTGSDGDPANSGIGFDGGSVVAGLPNTIIGGTQIPKLKFTIDSGLNGNGDKVREPIYKHVDWDAPYYSPKHGYFPAVGMIVDYDPSNIEKTFVKNSDGSLSLRPWPGDSSKTWGLRTDGNYSLNGSEFLPACTAPNDLIYRMTQQQSPRFISPNGTCSAFLYSNKTAPENFEDTHQFIMTARHCITSQVDLTSIRENYMNGDVNQCIAKNDGARKALNKIKRANLNATAKFKAIIFGFGKVSSGSGAAAMYKTRFSKDDIYPLESVVAGAKDDSDLAIVKLTRPVPTSHIKPLRIQQSVQDNDSVRPLLLAGHPSGLPKIFDSDQVVAFDRRSEKPFDMRISADNYAGNSGSPVIDVETGEVTGLIVCGQKDFEIQGEDSNRCVAELSTVDLGKTQEIAVSLPNAFEF